MTGKISTSEMQRLNYEADGKGKEPAVVAEEFLKSTTILINRKVVISNGRKFITAIIQLLCYELWLSMDLFFKHLLMSVYGVLFAALIGIPLGILLARYTKLSGFVITIANIIQTVPVIAMLAILMLVMGLGSETVVLTVFYMRYFQL